MNHSPATRPFLAFAAVLILFLAACSTGGGEDPTPTPEPTAPPTLAPGQLTVGQLLDGMSSAFANVGNARTVFTSRTTDGTPTTSPVTTEVWVAPDKRQIQTASGGTVVDDQIAIGNRIYMRGAFVTSTVAPMVSTDIWITLDPALVPPGTPVGNVLTYLTSPFRLPFANVSDGMRARGVTAAGQTQVAGRTCTVYTFADTTSFGDLLEYQLAIDDRGLPCSLTERAGTFENVTTFEFDVPGLDVIAPDAATPVTGTPEG